MATRKKSGSAPRKDPSKAKSAAEKGRVARAQEDKARDAARARLMKAGVLATPRRSLSPRVD